MRKIPQTAIVAFPAFCVLLAAWAVSGSPRAPLTLPPSTSGDDEIPWFPATDEYILPTSVRVQQEHKTIRPEDIGEPYTPTP